MGRRPQPGSHVGLRADPDEERLAVTGRRRDAQRPEVVGEPVVALDIDVHAIGGQRRSRSRQPFGARRQETGGVAAVLGPGQHPAAGGNAQPEERQQRGENHDDDPPSAPAPALTGYAAVRGLLRLQRWPRRERWRWYGFARRCRFREPYRLPWVVATGRGQAAPPGGASPSRAAWC